MALAYVTRAEAKEFCRIQHTALDDTIDLQIQAASARIKNYLKDFSPYQGLRNDDDDFVVDSNYEPIEALDSNSEQVVRAEVKLAVLMLVNMSLKGLDDGDGVDLPPSVKGCVYQLRDPALR